MGTTLKPGLYWKAPPGYRHVAYDLQRGHPTRLVSTANSLIGPPAARQILACLRSVREILQPILQPIPQVIPQPIRFQQLSIAGALAGCWVPSYCWILADFTAGTANVPCCASRAVTRHAIVPCRVVSCRLARDAAHCRYQSLAQDTGLGGPLVPICRIGGDPYRECQLPLYC